MKELTYTNKIHLDKWDIDVVPYLSMEQIDLIYDIIKDEQNPLNSERQIIADVLVCCTGLYDKEDADYTYEELVYSGLWGDILEACPYIKTAIDSLNQAVEKYNSTERALTTIANHLTTTIEYITDFINSEQFAELAKRVNEKIEE